MRRRMSIIRLARKVQGDFVRGSSVAKTSGRPKKIELTQPKRSRVDEAMKTYSRVVRRERPPAEREKFAVRESDRLQTIS